MMNHAAPTVPGDDMPSLLARVEKDKARAATVAAELSALATERAALAQPLGLEGADLGKAREVANGVLATVGRLEAIDATRAMLEGEAAEIATRQADTAARAAAAVALLGRDGTV